MDLGEKSMRTYFLGVFCALALLVSPPGSAAQFIGYTSPQSEQQTLGVNQTCTGSPQTFAIKNLGQTQHYLSVSSLSGETQFQGEIDGIDTQGNVYRISDVLETAGFINARQGSISASGYFPKVQVSITCSPNTATYTATYSGAWGTFNSSVGSYLSAAIDKMSFNQASAASNQSDIVQTPYGSTAGTIYFGYTGWTAGNGILSVICNSNVVAGSTTVATFTTAGNNGPQAFQVPDVPCASITVQFNKNTVAATTVTAEYLFLVPGRSSSAYQYTHVTGTTATAVKATPGLLHTLSVNTGGAGTISIFDLASASCTGTPATNVVAVVTATASTLQTFTYDANFQNGICVKASVAMDFTVSAQ